MLSRLRRVLVVASFGLVLAFVGGGPIRAVDGTIVAQNMGAAFASGQFISCVSAMQ